jgi:thermostable 8-oxoguanine DNA glycosylase
VEDHLAEDIGCRSEVGILDDHIAERAEHYKVAGVGCKCVGALERHIADSVDRAHIVTEVDQLAADILELEAQV